MTLILCQMIIVTNVAIKFNLLVTINVTKKLNKILSFHVIYVTKS